MPVEFEVLAGRVGSVFLYSVADVSKDFGFGGVVDFGMIFDLIDGPEAEVSRGDSLLTASGELNDRDVESPGSFFENFKGGLFLSLHVELKRTELIILLKRFKLESLIILLRARSKENANKWDGRRG